MSHNKVKGLLKGLRYISNIFENEKDQPEMQIGLPTDVKHVAHIGWDGPSVNSPSWMNEFKAPEIGGGDIKHEASSIKSEVVEDSSSKRSGRDPVLPKSTRRHSSTEEPTRERSEKSSTSRRSKHMNKDSSSESIKSKNSSEGGDVPKKSRRMKSRDSADGSSRTSRRGHSLKSDAGSECGSMSKSVDNDNDNNNQEEDSQSSCVIPSEEGQEKEHTGVS